jgi:hypothetical protein
LYPPRIDSIARDASRASCLAYNKYAYVMLARELTENSIYAQWP